MTTETAKTNTETPTELALAMVPVLTCTCCKPSLVRESRAAVAPATTTGGTRA